MSAPILATVLSLKNGGVLPPIGGGAYINNNGPVLEGYNGADWLLSGYFIDKDEAPLVSFTSASLWTDITASVPFGTSSIRGIATDANSAWVAVGNSGKAARSTDNGVTWTDITAAVPFGTSIIWAVATDANSAWVAVGDAGKAARSTDNGVTWTDITASVPFGTSNIFGIATDANSAWVAVGDAGKAARSMPLVGFETPVDNLYMRIA